MRTAVLAGLCLVFTAMTAPAVSALCRSWKLQRQNFKGKTIPAGFGLLIIAVAVPVYIALGVQQQFWQPVGAYLAAVAGFGILGLLDDLYGTREAGGFRGHVGLLLKGRISTGLLKALGGGILGLTLGFAIAGWNIKFGLINGILISLSANTLNLLDLRPGRAVSCFWAGILILAAAKFRTQSDLQELVPVAVPAVWLTVLDRSAKVMLGDAGSNVLGAVLGLALACALGPPSKLLLIALMVAVNLYSEKYSISKLIEGNRVLRSVDRLLGER